MQKTGPTHHQGDGGRPMLTKNKSLRNRKHQKQTSHQMSDPCGITRKASSKMDLTDARCREVTTMRVPMRVFTRRGQGGEGAVPKYGHRAKSITSFAHSRTRTQVGKRKKTLNCLGLKLRIRTCRHQSSNQ